MPYKQLTRLIWDAKDQVSFIGSGYNLGIKETYISPEIVEVFKYGATHYIAMHESLEMTRPDYGYAVIAKYTGGKITTEDQAGLKDICYFKRTKSKN